MRKMPIGMQMFDEIVTGGYAYVDKTVWVYELAKEGKYFFLGRPRRFGKSLLLSTLRAYFEGKKELFEGLAIEKLEKEWTPYPVFHINLNVMAYGNIRDLSEGLDTNLRIYEERWGVAPRDAMPSTRFFDLIRRAYESTGQKVVVLIDEYDRPLTQTMERGKPNDDIRDALKGFYGVLKSADEWLRFVLLTGVTKFSRVSVFSDLNMLRDISMSERYAGICGITAQELEDNFKDELAALAKHNGMAYGEAVAKMKKRYDGYLFAKQGERMFNPYSVLNTFVENEFAYYWFVTGTPTFLVEQIKQGGFDPLRFADADSIVIPAESMDEYRLGDADPLPLLYQSGYLTITGYDRQTGEYTLAFPNEEVRYGFLNALLPAYTYRPPGERGFYVRNFLDDLRRGDVAGFMERMRSFFADIPYELDEKTERHYQLVFYLVFTLMGQYARAETHSAIGRADLVVWMSDTIYVFEFKLNGTAEQALRQIDEKGYGVPYESDGRRIVKIGVEFDADARNIGRYLMADNG
jgi:hypothetical protein